MNLKPKPKPVVSPGRPVQPLDLAAYHRVTITKTAEVHGHLYRAGQKPMVDAATLAALRDGGMIGPDVVAAG